MLSKSIKIDAERDIAFCRGKAWSKRNERKDVPLNCSLLFYENTHSFEAWSLSMYIFSHFSENRWSYLCNQMEMSYGYIKNLYEWEIYLAKTKAIHITESITGNYLLICRLTSFRQGSLSSLSGLKIDWEDLLCSWEAHPRM